MSTTSKLWTGQSVIFYTRRFQGWGGIGAGWLVVPSKRLLAVVTL